MRAGVFENSPEVGVTNHQTSNWGVFMTHRSTVKEQQFLLPVQEKHADKNVPLG